MKDNKDNNNLDNTYGALPAPLSKQGLIKTIKIETTFGVSVSPSQIEECDNSKEELIEVQINKSEEMPALLYDPICPRATVELSQANALLKSLRLAFLPNQATEQKIQSDAIEITEGSNLNAGTFDENIIEEESDSYLNTIQEEQKSQLSPELISLLKQHFAKIAEDGAQKEPKLHKVNDEQELEIQNLVKDEQFNVNNPVLTEAAQIIESDVEVDSEVNSENKNNEFSNQCVRLAATKEFDQLATVAATPKEDINPDLARMWWIYSQEKLGGLSSVLLAAPLKELVNSVVADEDHFLRIPLERDRLIQLARHILKNLLVEDSGYLDGYALVKSLERLVNDITLLALEKEKILNILKAKEAYALTSTERAILDELISQKSEIKKLKRETDLKPSDLTAEIKLNQQELEILEQPVPALMANDQPIISLARLNKDQRIRRVQNIKRSRVNYLVAIAATVLIALYFVPTNNFGFLTSANSTTALTVLPTDPPQLIMPAHSPYFTGLLEGLLIDAEFNDRTNGGEQVNVSGEVAINKSIISSEGNLRVNTTEPVEPDALVAAIKQGEEVNNRGRIVGRDFVKGVGKDLNSGSSIQQGSVIVPELYLIITDTVILKEPTFDAPVLEKVKRGSKVRVIEQVGSWLRLSAQDGRYGYIVVHDAVKDTGRRS